jgi:hypothetical protein
MRIGISLETSILFIHLFITPEEQSAFEDPAVT